LVRKVNSLHGEAAISQAEELDTGEDLLFIFGVSLNLNAQKIGLCVPVNLAPDNIEQIFGAQYRARVSEGIGWGGEETDTGGDVFCSEGPVHEVAIDG
jgi:hypothetical protein